MDPYRRIGGLKGGWAAIDGSKFNAVNNRDRNLSTGPSASGLADPAAGVGRCNRVMVRIDNSQQGEARAEKVADLARRYGRVRQKIERLRARDTALAETLDGKFR